MIRTLTISAFACLMLACGAPAEEQASTNSDLSPARLDSLGIMQSEGLLDRGVVVYLPKGYDGERKFPVVYMHDGQMLFEEGWNGQEWGVDEYFDTASVKAIIVGVENTANRLGDYMPNEPLDEVLAAVATSPNYDPEKVQMVSDQYLRFLVNELKPEIDSRYATLSDPNNTHVAGSSMGGLISFFAITQYPEVFGAAACISSHWPAGDGVLVDAYVPTVPSPNGHRLWMDYGTATLDSLYEPYQMRVDSILQTRGWSKGDNWQTKKYPGARHDEDSWRERLPDIFGFLLG